MASPLFRLYIASSLDGIVATPDGGVEWLVPFESEDYGYDGFIADIDTVVMGRATYQQVRGFDGDWPYAGKRAVVLTSRMLMDPPAGVETHNGDVVSLIDDLRQNDRGDVWIVGGAETIGRFLQHRAIDRIELFLMPLFLGAGLRLFDHSRLHAQLKLQDLQQYPSGVVKLTYGVA